MRPSRISPDVLINESLGAADLATSPMCANGMKLLIYARDNTREYPELTACTARARFSSSAALASRSALTACL